MPNLDLDSGGLICQELLKLKSFGVRLESHDRRIEISLVFFQLFLIYELQ